MAFNMFKTLRVYWSKREKDWMINYPTSASGHMMSDLLAGRIDFKEFIEELKERGYDTRSLKLSVQKREFKCIKDCFKDEKKIFEKDDIVYMKSVEKDNVGFTNNERFSYYFSTNPDEENYFKNYFIELTKK